MSTPPTILVPSTSDSVLDSPSTTMPTIQGNILVSRALGVHTDGATTYRPRNFPPRLSTDPTLYHTTEDLHVRIKKRIIVCCDGTWQDGISTQQKSKFTNILRLARSINYQDDREPGNPPIPQVLFYQTGVGTDCNLYDRVVDGATGSSLVDKVEEAYGFIAHNYSPGDEIFLFGFSRGAYTARMVASFIGEIGVLDRSDMDDFAQVFLDYQRYGNSRNAADREAMKLKLERWDQHKARGKARADPDRDTFTIKCVGVFDTVGSLGLPEELTIGSRKARMLFGFHDSDLGEHIQYAFQALALHETRADFDCNKFTQTPKGKEKGQVLRQCWFAGSHSDIGGSYPDHDLADITLAWMAAHVGTILSLDVKYLSKIPKPVAAWGKQVPHDSATGLFSIARTIQRTLPKSMNDTTHECIHPSVKLQASLPADLSKLMTEHPEIICHLLPLEEELQTNWPFVPESPLARNYTDRLENQNPGGIVKTLSRAGSRLYKTLFGQPNLNSAIKIAEEAHTVEVENQKGTVKLESKRRSLIVHSFRGKNDLQRRESQKESWKRYSAVEPLNDTRNVTRSISVK